MAPVSVYIAWTGHPSAETYVPRGPLSVSPNAPGPARIQCSMTVSYTKQPSCGKSSISTCRGVDTDYAYVFSPHSVVYMVAQIHARTPIKCVHTWASRCVVRLCVPVFYACVFVFVCVCACMRVHMREAAASPVCVRRVCLPVSQVCNVRACACIWCTQLCRLLYTQTTEKTELMYPLLFPEIELELFPSLPLSLSLSLTLLLAAN